jgi:hypothetical protein
MIKVELVRNPQSFYYSRDMPDYVARNYPGLVLVNATILGAQAMDKHC